MRETTIRRLLVIVLCASGVVALWIVADRSLSTPDAAYSAMPETSSRSGPSPASSPAASRSGSHDAGRSPTSWVAPHVPRTQPPSHGAVNPASSQPVGQQLPDPELQPPAVRGLRVIQADHDSITIRWSAVRSKRVGHTTPVAYYTVTLNGIPAGETAGLELTINWFNDDMAGPHFIRVRAVDANGNHGLPGSALVVLRPPPDSPPPSPSTPTNPAPGPTTPPAPEPTPSQSPGTPSPAPLNSSSGPTTSPTAPIPSNTPTNAPTGRPSSSDSPGRASPTLSPSPSRRS